jgi:2-ketoarginine methyltransferase
VSAVPTELGPLVAGQARTPVGPGFEQRLIEAIRPIAEHYLAGALHALFSSGVYDELADRALPVPIPHIAAALHLDEHRLRGLLLFLGNEGVTAVEDDAVSLTAKGRQYGEFRGWYTMMIGGYAQTVQQLADALPAGSPAATRNGRYVGQGSCEVSRYDGMPITRTLLDRAGVTAREVLDLGCGDGLYLVELCRELPGVSAWGAEPDPGGYAEAVAQVERAGLADRVRLSNTGAIEFLNAPPAGCDPNVIVLGYVLHEVLAQAGEQAVVALLQNIVRAFPKINIVVIEVAAEIDNRQLMRHGLARNFWNPYYLLHYFTPQLLRKRPYWDRLFRGAGLELADLVTTDPSVDSTGLELGYLLRKAQP